MQSKTEIGLKKGFSTQQNQEKGCYYIFKITQMLNISIPGFHDLNLIHAVFDLNGTLAFDGHLLAGVAEELIKLSSKLELHIITSDCHGTAQSILESIDCNIIIVDETKQDAQKAAYIQSLGPANCVAFGNGRNDRLMLQKASLGIAVIGREGCSIGAMFAADAVVNDIIDGLDLLTNPKRLQSLLRS